MNNIIKKNIKKYLKYLKLDFIFYYLRARIYINKIAVTVEKELINLPSIDDSLIQNQLELVSITSELLCENSAIQKPIRYADSERLKTAIDYLGKGYCGVGLVGGNEILGDIWYTNACNSKHKKIHPDLKWLGMEGGDRDVYAFDMLVPAVHRGKNLATLLQMGALHMIKNNGYSRAFGYYWAENIPALWVHRLLKWNELKRLKVTRFLHMQFGR